jgi:TorA maturation chaperone TorD
VAAGLALLQQWTQASRSGQLHFLAVAGDYTRLFVGPGKIVAPPWESAQIDDERLTFQEETLAVRAWYRRYGVLPAQLHAEPDDHIGLELAFMAHLAQLALAAQAAGDTARLADLLAAERGFLRAHPLRWAPKWCGRVGEAARTDYYRGLALVTAGVLAELSTALEPLTQLAVA